MAQDPGFIFYPGDYLRDTQCLSEKSQVAYDRIMCEHMRNICISQKQLDFFTKRLSPEEKEEIIMILTQVECGFQIHWVAESISKRRAYSESRRKNRTKTDEIISKTYDKHMDNENEIEDVIKVKIKNEKVGGKTKRFIPPDLAQVKEYFKENGFSEQAACKAFNHYDVADWHDTHGKPVRSWKQKMSTNWFKDEYKIVEEVPQERKLTRDEIAKMIEDGTLNK